VVRILDIDGLRLDAKQAVSVDLVHSNEIFRLKALP
jgi:hypothetical protein